MNSLWKREVALCLVPLLGDPGLITHVLDILRPLQRDHDEKEARVFHRSLRINRGERWKRLTELSGQRKFHLMNPSVPITCTLPFDGGMWRKSKQLLKMVRYFRDGFMVSGHMSPQCLPEKVRTVNLIYDGSTEGSEFRSGWCLASIEESLFDYELLEGEEFGLERVELPSLLTESRGDSSFLTIVN